MPLGYQVAYPAGYTRRRVVDDHRFGAWAEAGVDQVSPTILALQLREEPGIRLDENSAPVEEEFQVEGVRVPLAVSCATLHVEAIPAIVQQLQNNIDLSKNKNNQVTFYLRIIVRYYCGRGDPLH